MIKLNSNNDKESRLSYCYNLLSFAILKFSECIGHLGAPCVRPCAEQEQRTTALTPRFYHSFPSLLWLPLQASWSRQSRSLWSDHSHTSPERTTIIIIILLLLNCVYYACIVISIWPVKQLLIKDVKLKVPTQYSSQQDPNSYTEHYKPSTQAICLTSLIRLASVHTLHLADAFEVNSIGWD